MRRSLTVYCSGSPNFFIYGVDKNGDTFSFINNQYWVPASTNINEQELSKMVVVCKDFFNTLE